MNRMDGENLRQLILSMLVKHLPYAESIYIDYGETIPGAGFCHTGSNGEDGIRTAANYAYFYAFLFAHSARDLTLVLPRQTLLSRARSCLVYLTETNHSAEGGFVCTNGKKWGKVWQSSLWTSYAGAAAWLIWDELEEPLRSMVERLVVAEADHIAAIVPPIGEWSDTKAEENGWDSTILALAANLFKAHPHAPQWEEKATLYMMNSLSVAEDLTDETVVDGRPVRDWVLGANLHPDFTMENHDIFHPIYQMVVTLELGASALFYRMGGKQPPAAVNHHQLDNWHRVLRWVSLPDGEWLYPNGLDWMMHDYEHLATLAFLSVYYREPEAMKQESIVACYHQRRQERQQDGSFFGRLIDIGPRRESVAAQRLIDTYLFHLYFGSWEHREAAAAWKAEPLSGTRYYPSTKIVLHRNREKAASFSWQKRVMGMLVPDPSCRPDQPYVVVPYPFSFVGYWEVEDRPQDFRCESQTVDLRDDGFATTGLLSVNGQSMKHALSFTSLPGGLVVYMDDVVAETDLIVRQECGLPLGIERDPVWGAVRTMTHAEGTEKLPEGLRAIPGEWVNFDGALGIAVRGGQAMAVGDTRYRQAGTNNVLFFGSNAEEARSVVAGETVGARCMVAAANLTPEQTRAMHESLQLVDAPAGWRAVAVRDPQTGARWLIASNFAGDECSSLESLQPGRTIELRQPPNTTAFYQLEAVTG